MNLLLSLFNYYGINLDEPSLPLAVFLSGHIFLFTIVSVISFVNLAVYFIILQVSDTKIVLKFIENKNYLKKIISFYKKTTIFTISIEIIFFILANYFTLNLCFIVINGYYKIL